MMLVIAYGNPLRGDDAVGWAIAERLQDVAPDITVLTRRQLVPELAELISESTTVVFVDARYGDEPGRVRCTHVTALRPRAARSKGLTPARLLTLAVDLFHHEPDAYLVTVGVEEFEIGRDLSKAAADAVPVAAAMIRKVLGLSARADDLRRRISGQTRSAPQ